MALGAIVIKIVETINEDLMPVALCMVVLTVFVAILNTYWAVRDDETITPEDTAKIQSWIRWFGPAGVVQLLLFTYFHNSKLSGH